MKASDINKYIFRIYSWVSTLIESIDKIRVTDALARGRPDRKALIHFLVISYSTILSANL